MYSNEEATDIVSSIRRETIFIYPVMNSLKSRDQYNSLMGEACLTREASFPCDLLDTIEGQNAFLTRITSIKEVQHVSFHKSSGCNYGSISLCHIPFPLHFESDSFLPDRLASIFLIPALSILHCPNADNRLTFNSRLAPYVSGLGINGTGVSEVRLAGSGTAGVFT